MRKKCKSPVSQHGKEVREFGTLFSTQWGYSVDGNLSSKKYFR